MDRSRIFSSKEGEVRFLNWKGDGVVLWDSSGILLIDYQQHGQIINEAYYASLLDQPDKKIIEMRLALAKAKVLHDNDNAPAHKTAIARAKLGELR